MQSDNPASPLYWVEVVGKRVLKLADDSIAFGSLTSADADHMRHLRQETENLLGMLLGHLKHAPETKLGIALPMSFCISKLLEDALVIGLIAPAISESAKAAIAAGRAKSARAGKAETPRARALDNALQQAVPAGWGGEHSWALAGKIKTTVDALMLKAGFKGISQQAIYDRLRKRQTSNRG
jgi:hypothetical protein